MSKKLSISITDEQFAWLTATSVANKDCGISKLIQSLIVDQMEQEQRVADMLPVGTEPDASIEEIELPA